MVFESLVANLINKYLAQFIDEVSAEQLNIGTWKGGCVMFSLLNFIKYFILRKCIVKQFGNQRECI